MFLDIFKKKKPKRKAKITKTPKAPKHSDVLDKKLAELSTKDDIERIIKEVVSSREIIVQEVGRIPDSLSSLLTEGITSPLKDFISSELSSSRLSTNQAVKQVDVKQLSTNQAVKQFDDVVAEMKGMLERLSQRHLKILDVLVQNREMWLAYDEIGQYCSPQLSGSCIRGYVSDLINSYNIPIEKKNVGRKSKIKISKGAVKQLALTKLSA